MGPTAHARPASADWQRMAMFDPFAAQSASEAMAHWSVMLHALPIPAALVGEDGITEDDVLIHDEREPSGALSFLLARLEPPTFPTALGVVKCVERESYDGMVVSQEADIVAQRGKGELKDLLRSGETWNVG